MPFKSKAQQAWMFANKPGMAEEWASETPNIKNLPQKKSGSPTMGDLAKKKSKAPSLPKVHAVED